MKRLVSVVVIMVWMLFGAAADIWAQCAMCRGSVESTMGNGRNNVGIGLNLGIVYLFVVPYLAVAAIAFFWYRSSRKEQARRNLVIAAMQRAEGAR